MSNSLDSIPALNSKIESLEADNKLLRESLARHVVNLDECQSIYRESVISWRRQFENMHQRAMKAEKRVKQLEEELGTPWKGVDINEDER